MKFTVLKCNPLIPTDILFHIYWKNCNCIGIQGWQYCHYCQSCVFEKTPIIPWMGSLAICSLKRSIVLVKFSNSGFVSPPEAVHFGTRLTYLSCWGSGLLVGVLLHNHNLESNTSLTRKHSSRMRTARLLAGEGACPGVCVGALCPGVCVCLGVCIHGCVFRVCVYVYRGCTPPDPEVNPPWAQSHTLPGSRGRHPPDTRVKHPTPFVDRQTSVKTLLCPKLRLWAVKKCFHHLQGSPSKI